MDESTQLDELELKKLPTVKNNPEDEDRPDIWEGLKLLKKRGLWKGEVDVIPIKEFNLSIGKGAHYFVVEDAQKRSIKCTTCPITHGTILEARLLHLYRIDDGVLYLNDKPLNKRASIDTDGKTK